MDALSSFDLDAEQLEEIFDRIEKGGVEIKRRDQGKDQMKIVPPADAVATVKELLK